LRVALVSSELAGVAETRRARVASARALDGDLLAFALPAIAISISLCPAAGFFTSSLRKETAQSLAVAVEAIAQRVYEVDDVAGVEA
jgi:hypothetical protein